MLSAKSLPAGVILAGGRSRRMLGQNKALLKLNGKPLMQHVIDRLRPQVSSLAVSVDREQQDYLPFGLRQIADLKEGSRGPLGGLLAALATLPEGVDLLLLVPCDAPFLPLSLQHRLAGKLNTEGKAVCVVRYEEELQPTFSLWHRRLLPDLKRAVLDESRAGFKQFLRNACFATLDWECAEIPPFFNINSPADLEQAQTIFDSGLFPPRNEPT